MLPTTIIDDFFPNPDKVREYAFNIQEWNTDEDLRWPGIRTKSLQDIDLPTYAEMIFHIRQCLPHYIIANNPAGFKQFDLVFQIVDKSYGSGWLHHDANNLDFAGLIYLTPNPPQNSGTLLYQYNSSEELKYFGEEETKIRHEFLQNPNDNQTIKDLKQKRLSQFKQVANVENVYNRCVFYDARTWHCADNYFGDNKNTARLALVFFGAFNNG